MLAFCRGAAYRAYADEFNPEDWKICCLKYVKFT